MQGKICVILINATECLAMANKRVHTLINRSDYMINDIKVSNIKKNKI